MVYFTGELFHFYQWNIQITGKNNHLKQFQYCAGGSVIDFVKRLQSVNRRLSEEHIAYILKEAANALVELHKQNFVHRDVRGTNILLTADGEVKLCDFGLTKSTGSQMGKRSTCIGSPCWMAPEMFLPSTKSNEELYGNRIDVWALGITAIEVGDGTAPFIDMHPTRAMFQIIRNPPPTLYRPANWTQNYNDFIAESVFYSINCFWRRPIYSLTLFFFLRCLEKNPDNRPFMVELLEHPFFTELCGATGSDHHVNTPYNDPQNDKKKLFFFTKFTIFIIFDSFRVK